MEIMNKKNKKWNEFVERLGLTDCKGGNDKSSTIKIMKEMGDINIEDSIEYFDRNGGFCDCEILLNVNGVDE